jgi:hyaluronoglucosaminidase
VIEGFYGPPWAPEARVALIEFVAEHGMNAYVYAPKSDPKHRDRWREPYNEHESSHFRVLATRSAECGVQFGFAISPGLDVDYAASHDREALLAKVAPILDQGVGWVVLALDDIPTRPGLAAEQAVLATWLLDALSNHRPDVRLTLVPTEYVGTRPTPYLRDLGAGLPAAVDVMWTGPTVCSPTISAREARAWASALGGRKALLWDNYPVNDGPMERSLHLGPYRGRAAELSDELGGVLCNPMTQAHASRVALATAADYLADPSSYDAGASWRRAVENVGGVRAPALGALAAACEDGPLLPAAHLVAHRLVAAVAETITGPDWIPPVAELRDHFLAVQEAARAWSDSPSDPLGRELEPWLGQGRAEAGAGLAALRLLQQLRPVAPPLGAPAASSAHAPDAELALMHVFGLVLAWSAAMSAGDRVVFGPRFAVYPAVIQLSDGRPGLDVDLAVVEDGSAIDRVCRLALEQYREWSALPAGDATVSRSSNADVLVECGPLSTRLGRAAGGLPFPDARLR